MSKEELTAAFNDYAQHKRECDRNRFNALNVWMNNGNLEPRCSCGLAEIKEQLGLQKEADMFM